MRPRHDTVETFSTFIQFEADRFGGWIADSRLRRSIQRRLETSSDLPEALWARYWHEIWTRQSDSLASQHLLAYLQEPCYYATQQVLNTFGQYLSVQYRLSDCFQEAIACTDSVLKSFNPNWASLNTYAQEVFRRTLANIFRERRETEACSDWALLRRVKNKRLTDSLERVGLSSLEIDQYRLAWMCFKALYAPSQIRNTDRLPKPDRAVWEAIAQLYNRERLSQLSPPGVACNPERMEQWMTRCASAIRAYKRLTTRSLDAPKPGQESGGLVDDLPGTPDGSLLDQVIVQEEVRERGEQQFQVQEVLLASLKQLDQEIQTIVQLYYQQGLKQVQIAEQLTISQVKVCRRLNKAKEVMLAELVQWSQRELNKVPTVDLIEKMKTALEEWLRIRYGELGLASGKGTEEEER